MANWFEDWYLHWVHETLTYNWAVIQGGTSGYAKTYLNQIWQVLELDSKAIADWYLLAQQSENGRTQANKILWELLSWYALEPDYRNLSALLSHLVGTSRRNHDRPPRHHDDFDSWYWAKYWEPREGTAQYGPRRAPVPWTTAVEVGPRGEPLAPPACWPGEFQ